KNIFLSRKLEKRGVVRATTACVLFLLLEWLNFTFVFGIKFLAYFFCRIDQFHLRFVIQLLIIFSVEQLNFH
ncbi:hypothetical protein, partial [Bathymodiolus azoricus thioautotrophic gill symbiont]|uniref:hypothetical protein n=1 Tax=Bathymodiolus azoricus thioautotrophic gill symbiont TaxID=235205 RepID=UPI0019D39F2C